VIYPPKFALYVTDHLLGAKNGKKIGRMLNTVVKVVVEKLSINS
jgi:hypothetical protein